jgi:hypothetical protein
VFGHDPSDRFIMAREAARTGDQLLHQCIRLMFFDEKQDRLRRMSFFSYGFGDNETECAWTDDEIEFDVVH